MSYCPISTMMCNPDNCGLYSPDHNACKIKLALDKYLGMDATPKKTEPQPLIPPKSSPVEDKIKRILALKPNLTREAVERLIDEERAKAAGLLTEEAAAHLVASNLGLDRDPGAFPPEAFEENNYVTLTGEVVEPAEVREVDTRGGPKMVANIRLTDGSQTVRVGIWGDLISGIEGLDKGDTVTVTNLKVRPPYDGISQLSSTKNTRIS